MATNVTNAQLTAALACYGEPNCTEPLVSWVRDSIKSNICSCSSIAAYAVAFFALLLCATIVCIPLVAMGIEEYIRQANIEDFQRYYLSPETRAAQREDNEILRTAQEQLNKNLAAAHARIDELTKIQSTAQGQFDHEMQTLRAERDQLNTTITSLRTQLANSTPAQPSLRTALQQEQEQKYAAEIKRLSGELAASYEQRTKLAQEVGEQRGRADDAELNLEFANEKIASLEKELAEARGASATTGVATGDDLVRAAAINVEAAKTAFTAQQEKLRIMQAQLTAMRTNTPSSTSSLSSSSTTQTT